MQCSQLFQWYAAEGLRACVGWVIVCVEVLETDNLIGDLLDHEVDADEEVFDSFSVTAVIAGQRDHTLVVRIQCGWVYLRVAQLGQYCA